MKGPADKNFEGIYANPRFMHAAGIIVGCVVHVQVKSGSLYEGVLRTFSSKADFVLEMARKLDSKKIPIQGAFSNSAFSTITSPDEVIDKLVFRFEDVIMITASNVDPDFATRESFSTDSAISRCNGQILERELEPWDGGPLSSDGLSDLGAAEEANGWDPNDMFRTNEVKYGVKSSFDSTLPGYTIPLSKQNTEEYKQQEAKASKIAQEIESGLHHKNRCALENGDEEDRFSAVVRPENNVNNNNNNYRYVSNRMKNSKFQNMNRNLRGNPSPMHHGGNRNSHPQVQVFGQRVSSPASNASQGNYKMVSVPTCLPNMSPRPTPTSTPVARPQVVVPLCQMAPPPPQFQQVVVSNTSMSVTPPPHHPPLPVTMIPQDIEGLKVNGDVDKTELKYVPKPQRNLNLQPVACKEGNAIASPQIANKSIERRKEVDKKALAQKAREDKTEGLKRFHVDFKLKEKDPHDPKESTPKGDVSPGVKLHKEKPKEDERKADMEMASSPDTPKSSSSSSLNPNAKEFVFNPNAKSFTPRAIAVPSMVPPPVQPPPRLHTQSPIMAVPQPHLMPGLAQTVFNMPHHYVVSTTPLQMPVAPPFNPNSMQQPPRLRKGVGVGHSEYRDAIFSALPMTLQRHDLSQPVHVQAATGQPILAQPQFAIQYAPSPPGMLHHHHTQGPPQQLAYAQMYSLMPRVLPQTVGMVPTSAAYGDNSQIQTHLYMSHQGTPSMQQHAMTPNHNQQQQQQQHSAPSTPQSQTPNNLTHPAPSPVHQPPPPHPQPPTPNTPTPQQMVYHQHPLHHAAQNHQFAGSYAGTPQPIVLVPQQQLSHHGPHPVTFASSLQGGGGGPPSGATHILAHHPSGGMAMIPTSAAAMVHTQTMSGNHYVPHSQGEQRVDRDMGQKVFRYL